MKHPLADAFDHHVWATRRVIDACQALPPAQLDTVVPGTYGSIIDTLRHLVAGDCGYLHVLTDDAHDEIDEATMDVAALGTEMDANRSAWSELLASNPDPERVVVRHRDDGTDSHAPMGIRLAQAIHHGTDHRSQICTALSTLGVQPPEIDVWDFGAIDGRVFVTEAESTGRT